MKHLIKIESTAHGVLGVRHAGRDQQYCEAGELVTLKWQPDAGWGLKEAYYKDAGGNVTPISLIPTKINGKDVVTFTMPNANIVVGGVFKRFVIEDWTGKGSAFSIVGSFPTDKLPILDGMKDAGKIAFDETKKAYVHWDGYGWATADGKPVIPRYLTFTANEDGVSLAFFFNRNAAGKEQKNPNITFQKSTDGGLTWEEHTIGVYVPNDGDTSDLDVITLDEGESVMFKGVNSENFTVGDPESDEGIYLGFYLEGNAAASGDITSLINGVGGDSTIQFMQFYSMFSDCTGLTAAPALPATTLANTCYSSMFSGCTGLTQAPALPATTLAVGCYDFMFSDCTGLTQAPALPATTLAVGCYSYMFSGCTGLMAAPALPATTLAESCYSSMFSGCTGLTQAPALPATTLAGYCYSSMFNGCTGLVSAPALPATTLAVGCYSSMFNGCTGLTTAPALPATTLAESCYNFMFYGCTGISSHDVATLNDSQNTFKNNTSCASLTIHADTPPTIGNNTITGLKADCVIYVPAASVDAYKAKQYWSARAAYIQAKP